MNLRTCIVFCLCLVTTSVLAQHTSLILDNRISNPRFEFQSDPDLGLYYPYTTEIEGYSRNSYWNIMQWKKSFLLNPRRFHPPHILTDFADQFLGAPEYIYGTRDSNSQLRIYQHPDKVSLKMFELWGRNGIKNPGGGTNLFIAASSTIENAGVHLRENGFSGTQSELDVEARRTHHDETSDWSLSRRMQMNTWYGVDLKLKQWVRQYYTETADADNAAHAMFFTGFTFHYINPEGLRRTLFMQVRHANLDGNTGQHFAWRRNSSGQIRSALWGGTLETRNFLTNPRPNQPYTRMNYHLNKYLCAAIDRIVNNRHQLPEDDRMATPPVEHIKNLNNWEFRTLYIGLETYNQYDVDTIRNGNFFPALTENGRVGLRVQIGDIQVNRSVNRVSSFAQCE